MAKFSESLVKTIIEAFEKLTPDISGIYDDAKSYSISDWRVKQQAIVIASGGIAISIPGVHLAVLAADIAILMNRMSVCAYGIGAIYGYSKYSEDILEEEDFANILALWAGDDSISQMIAQKAGIDAVVKVAVKAGGKLGIKLLAKTIAMSGGILVGKKFAAKTGVKVGTKFATKIAGKASAGWIPVLGAAAGGLINWYFLTGIADAAEKYYKFKCEIIDRLRSTQ